MTTNKIIVERVGGLAGFGLPGSALKSIGMLDMLDLPIADRNTLENLFRAPPSQVSDRTADTFRYRLSRETKHGNETVEVPSSVVPASVTSVVKDGFS